MIDSHCHLADKQFTEDLSEVLQRAHLAGVERIIAIADSLTESEDCIRIAEKYDQIFCTVGVHPHASKEWVTGCGARLATLASSSSKVKAIGEIGLDYHYDFSPRDVQKKVFAEQLMISRALHLPVVVHNRESIADLKELLKEYPPVGMVLHCCTEQWEDVESLLEDGCHLSFTGIATYPKSEEVRRTIRECPLSRIMVETDAPYLAPQSRRGKRNEPAFVAEVLNVVSEIKGISVEEADRVTTETTKTFFGLS